MTNSLHLHHEFHDRPATRVLMLTHRVPYPPDRGDRIRSWHLLKQLRQPFEVSLACVSDEPVSSEQIAMLKKCTKRLAIHPIDPLVTRLRGLGALATGAALTPMMHYRKPLADQIVQWHAERPFDAVLTFCTGMIKYARLLTHVRYIPPKLHCRPIRHVLDLVDVDSMKWRRYAETSKPPMKWIYAAEARRLRCIEAGEQDWFDAITVVSEVEAQTYRDHVAQHSGLTVVTNGVNMKRFFALPDLNKPTIVFVGVLDYKPNVDGICWFVKEVLPRIAQQVPAAQLIVVGHRPSDRVAALNHQPNVRVVGSVPDVRKYLAKASAVIAPLHIAPGVQNKVLEAMASRKAVVCTPQAAAGIDAQPNEHLLVGESSRHFAALTARLLTDGEYRNRIAHQARLRIEQRYAWQRTLAPMIELLAGRSPEHRDRMESPLHNSPAATPAQPTRFAA